MPLTSVAIRNAKPKNKPYKLSDGGGLFLLVQPSGSKWWRYKYRYLGQEKLLALGIYPDVGLGDARAKHAEARKQLAAGVDPGEAKKEARRLLVLTAATTFESVSREWHERRKHEMKPNTAHAIMQRLEEYVFPKIGNRPIASIEAPEMLSVLRKIEEKGILDTAHRVKQVCGKIFLFAIATGRATRNPVPDLAGALKTPIAKHHAHLKESELPEFLAALERYDGDRQTKLALELLLLTFTRTTELRAAKITEFNFDKKEWRIPEERMKMRVLHLVPLSRQAVKVVKELIKLVGDSEYLFPNRQTPSRCMSENTMLFALYRMGYHSRATGHGFRSTASTILNENHREHGFSGEAIERQLAHAERDEVRAAYNYAQYLPERRKMMQWWADYLDDAGKKRTPPKN